MKGYKAFYRYEDKLRCRDKLYEVGKTYEEDKAVLCESGMHFCSLLIDTLIYYNAAHAVICEVEAPDELVEHNGGSYITKYCTTKLSIIREVPIDKCRYIAEMELDEHHIDPNVLGIDQYSAARTNSFRREAFEELCTEAAFRANDAYFRDEVAARMEEIKRHEGL